MSHRGPDGEGTFTDAPHNVILGHRRLAIIDPAHGAQPMTTPDGTITVVFNGAIYNYLELRRELSGKGHAIRSYSDTEVILYAWREWGERCVDRFLGMFAFAIWDRTSATLFCARDRVGIKPFYYVQRPGLFAFASEIKALLAAGTVRADCNRDGLKDYLTFQFCLGDRTLFKNVHRLEPGHALTVRVRDGTPSCSVRCYWDVDYTARDPQETETYVDELARLLEDAARIHLRSDVALGAHLSGGLDSSTVACLAASLLQGERLKTFTGAFREGPQFDETPFARAVAQTIGADYHETYITADNLDRVLPHLMHMMDEPVAGPGLIPQYYVSQLAARHVKVVLGGQGGDEIFVGYVRYLIPYLEQALNEAIAGRAGDGPTLADIAPNLRVLDTYRPMLARLWSAGLFGDAADRYFALVDRSEGMRDVFSGDVFTGPYRPRDAFDAVFKRHPHAGVVDQMTYFDLKASLPALLQVEDRTSMAVSIESRVPLLDHRVVELAASIPARVKFSSGQLKFVFREAVRNIVPRQILDRTDKMGFPVPLAHWYKGPARDFVRDTLLSQRARERGIYDVAQVERLLASDNSFSRVTWGLLCLELWFCNFLERDAAEILPRG